MAVVPEEVRQERIKNMIDAVNFREPKKVPVGLEVITWPFTYAGTTLKNVMHDPRLTAEAYLKFLDDIEFDYFALMPGITQHIPMYEALECNDYVLSIDDTCIEHYQTKGAYMTPEEYPMLIEDPYGFITEIMPRKNFKIFTKPKAEAYAALKKAAIAFKDFQLANDLISQEIYDNRKILNHMDMAGPGYFSQAGFVFDCLRGMVDTLTDMRRRPKVLDEACEAIAKQQAMPMPDPELFRNKSFPWGSTVYHIECFLGPKDFDKYFFSGLKKALTPYLEVGYKIFLKGEGQFLNTIERYRELPKGSVIMMLDQDDPFEVYKKIGDWQILATGITADLLKVGTLQQCKDYVDRCFDTFAPGGGFIFCNNKPLLGANDTQPDKLRELMAYVNELSRK
jgi:hypothetical protein